MRNIVIVTCARDSQQFHLLMLSMDRYLSDQCHVHVVWNDLGIMPQFLLEHHTLTQYARHQVLDINYTGTSGWHTQQLLKLFIWHQIQQSYLVLDSQLCLIGPVTWDLLLAEAQLHHTVTESRFQPWTLAHAAQQSWVMPPLLAAQSPYWFEHECLDFMHDQWQTQELADSFITSPSPSEYNLLDLIRWNCTHIRYQGTYPNLLVFINRINRLPNLLSSARISSIPSTFWHRARPVFLARHALDYDQHIAYNMCSTTPSLERLTNGNSFQNPTQRTAHPSSAGSVRTCL